VAIPPIPRSSSMIPSPRQPNPRVSPRREFQSSPRLSTPGRTAIAQDAAAQQLEHSAAADAPVVSMAPGALPTGDLQPGPRQTSSEPTVRCGPPSRSAEEAAPPEAASPLDTTSSQALGAPVMPGQRSPRLLGQRSPRLLGQLTRHRPQHARQAETDTPVPRAEAADTSPALPSDSYEANIVMSPAPAASWHGRELLERTPPCALSGPCQRPSDDSSARAGRGSRDEDGMSLRAMGSRASRESGDGMRRVSSSGLRPFYG